MTDVRPVFCGNFAYDSSVREIERLFDEFGPVERIDMKTGFAFVFMKDVRDGEDAIDKLDGMQFGVRKRPLRVQWAKGDGETKRREERRRKDNQPTSTLFIVNFDTANTRERDLEKHFSPYGKLRRVQIKRNYGFIQYESLDDAITAREATSLSRLLGHTITVEYVARDPNGESIDDSNPVRGRRHDSRFESRRSPGPRRRSRSPDYSSYGNGGGSRRRGRSRDRRDRQRSVTPPRRRRQSPARRASPSVSPARRASPSISPVRRQSPSPGRRRSRSPSVVPDANGTHASLSRSPPRGGSISRSPPRRASISRSPPRGASQ